LRIGGRNEGTNRRDDTKLFRERGSESESESRSRSRCDREREVFDYEFKGLQLAKEEERKEERERFEGVKGFAAVRCRVTYYNL
jgi:hypothetical protein